MIDWTQPVETDETPPRPVRVLATDTEGDWPVVFVIGDQLYACNLEGTEGACAQTHWSMPPLRNVPAKPVRHEVWCVLRNTGGLECWKDENQARKYAIDHPNVYAETRRIVWNSDGSPVSGADAGPEYWMNRFTEMTAERDAWRSKAEALQTDLSSVTAEALRADAIINRMKPVVDAAVALSEAHFLTSTQHFEALNAAVRAYKNAEPATSESHEAMVDAALDGFHEIPPPMKSCPTCRFHCKMSIWLCTERGYLEWEAKP